MGDSAPSFKCIIVGDGGTGKTTFIKRHLTGEFEKKYQATAGAQVHPVMFKTTRGAVRFQVWDTAGQEKYGGVKEVYYENADCAIIFFDLTSRVSYKNVARWHTELKRFVPLIPVVLCGNKADLRERKVKARSVLLQKQRDIQYFEVSARANYNFDKPFVWLSRLLLGDPNLIFLATPCLSAPDFAMDPTWRQKIEQELLQARQEALANNTA